MNETRNKIWTKNFIILSAVNFFLTLILLVLNVTITVYTINKFNSSTSQAGLVAGIFIFGSLIGGLYAGRLVQSKKLLVLGLILFLITILLYFIDYGIIFFIMSRFINGLSIGIATTVVSTNVALTLPESRKGEGISYFAISTALATGLGPFIGTYMNQHSSFNMIFSFCIVLGIISLATSLLLNFPKSNMKKIKHEKPEFKFSNFIDTKALPISIVIFIMTFCFSSVLSYINLYAMELDLLETASFFFIVYTTTVLISRPFTGRVMDKSGANYIMFPAFFIFGAGMLLLGAASDSLTLLLSAALIAFGFGNISSITQTISVNSATPSRMGLATATFAIFYQLGSAICPYIFGLVIPVAGYHALYAILGIIVFATSVPYYFLHGKKERTHQMLRN